MRFFGNENPPCTNHGCIPVKDGFLKEEIKTCRESRKCCQKQILSAKLYFRHQSLEQAEPIKSGPYGKKILTSDEQRDRCEGAVFRLEALQERSQGKSIQQGVEKTGVNENKGVQPVHYIIQISKVAKFIQATRRTYRFQS